MSTEYHQLRWFQLNVAHAYNLAHAQSIAEHRCVPEGIQPFDHGDVLEWTWIETNPFTQKRIDGLNEAVESQRHANDAAVEASCALAAFSAAWQRSEDQEVTDLSEWEDDPS
jgi:hypothetical protein